MEYADANLGQTLYTLAGRPSCYAWDCTGPRPILVRSNGRYGDGLWPAYTLGELYRMHPRATTWFKKETPRLGGMFSARTDGLAHYTARANSPEDAAATLQIMVERAKRPLR